MVPPTLRSAYLAMAERLSNATALGDTWDLVNAEGPSTAALYIRVNSALTAVRSAYLGTGCLTRQGRAYLGLPAVPVIDGEWPKARRGDRHGRG